LFGPEGLVVIAVGGAITGAVEASSQAIIVIEIVEK
jgi:hypothetical protein